MMRNPREPASGGIKKKLLYAAVLILTAACFALAIWLYLEDNSRLSETEQMLGSEAPDADNPAPVVDEILASNLSYPDENGACTDYIELYNPYSSELDISGWGLSDSGRVVKYTFPEGTVLDAEAYFVVRCSVDGSGEYAPFGISSERTEKIVLTDAEGNVRSEIRTILTAEDCSMVLVSGSWVESPQATPGLPNTAAGYAAWQEQEAATPHGLCFHEVLSSNSIYENGDGVSCDFIEFYNTAAVELDLTGWTVCSGSSEVLYTFGETGEEWYQNGSAAVSAGGYFVLWCISEPVYGGSCTYAPFGISAANGETLLLRNPQGYLIDRTDVPASDDGSGWSLNSEGSWEQVSYATPGMDNTEECYENWLVKLGYSNTKVYISELMADNSAVLADGNSEFCDWLELTNTGEEDAILTGWYLSDDPSNLTKYRLPELTIAAGESRVIFCGGTDAPGDIHTSFGLASEGETVTLSTPLGEAADSVSYTGATRNRSMIRSGDAFTETDYPTPGYMNSSDGYEAFCASRIAQGPLVISEMMAWNDSYLRCSYSTYPDWLELQNISDEEINLSDYCVTDSADNPLRCQLPDKVLEPGEYYVLYLSAEELSNAKYYTADFSLNSLEDSVFLFRTDGTLQDYTTCASVPKGCSYGRLEDGSFGYFKTPTPGNENGTGFNSIAEEPTVSLTGGLYDDVESVRVELNGSGSIYYTLDGSVPTASSYLYTGPLEFTETTVLRAVSIQEGLMISSVMTETYFINEHHTLPVVSLVSPYSGLFSSASGIYVKGSGENYYMDWERDANFAVYDSDGKEFDIDCGLKMFGAGSRRYCDKKSFKLLFRNHYEGALNYDVFGDGEVTTFYSLVLRGGEDYRFALIRDDLCDTLAKEADSTLMVQNMRQVILYIDGSYWGVYTIKEQYSEEYYASHMNVDADTVTVQSAPTTSGEFYQVMQKIRGMDMSKQENYEYACSVIDIDSLIDWVIFQCWSGNNDINVNVRYIKSTEDGLWRWCFFDQDWALYQRPTYKEVFEDGMQHGYIPRSMLKNAEFRQRYCERLAELCRTVLSTENVNKVMNSMIDALRPEIERERTRWGFTVSSWESNLATIDAYVNTYDRVEYLIKATVNYLGLSKSEQETYFGDLLN